MESPIFIVGTGRSGTSLLRLILNAHSHIAIPPELTYFNRCPLHTATSWRQPDFTESQYRTFVEAFMKQRVQERIFDASTTQQLIQEVLGAKHRRDLRLPYATVLKAYARRNKKRRWGEKSPPNLFYVDVIQDMFPDAKFILMVRDPRAGVRSMMNVPFFPNDVVFNALHRRYFANEGYSLLERHTVPAQRTTIRYEDLVSDPATEVKKLCRFLDVPFEKEMLQFHKEADEHLPPLVYTSKLKQPISDSSTEKWRQQLNASAIGIIESICSEEMNQFGYKFTGASPTLKDWMAIMTKSLYWRIYRWRLGDRRVYKAPDRMFARTQARLSKFFQVQTASN